MTKARISGVQAQMKEFNLFFSMVLGELILCHTDMLNQTLQKKDVCCIRPRGGMNDHIYFGEHS